MHSIHKSVLLHEIVKDFKEARMREGENLWYIDGTLGGAGHALAIAEAFDSKVNILGLDQDETAIERAKELLTGKCDRLVLVNENFRNLDKVMSQSGIETADMILLDLGLSSDELENSGRGFTFQKDEPLHMTYGNPDKQPFTALDIVNGWKEEDIANVIFGYGEERYARRVARRIVEYRTKKPIETSMELAEIVKGSMPRMFRKPKIHPATKTFQALRIAVNDELNALREGLAKGYSRLGKEGKIAVISFHSLEDRIVKEFFRSKESEDGAKITKKPIRAGAQEVAENPRSRSAKLRILQKKQ